MDYFFAEDTSVIRYRRIFLSWWFYYIFHDFSNLLLTYILLAIFIIILPYTSLSRGLNCDVLEAFIRSGTAYIHKSNYSSNVSLNTWSWSFNSSKFTFSDYTCLLSLQVLRISRVYPATFCDLSSIQEESTSAKSRRSLFFKHLHISGFPSFTMFVFHDNATTTNEKTMKHANLWNFNEKLQTGSSSIETFYATDQSTNFPTQLPSTKD